MKKCILLLFALMIFGTTAALAHDPNFPYPLLAKERLTIGARCEYDWYAGNSSGTEFLVDELGKEFHVGAVAAYALTGGSYPLSMIGGTTYGLDSKHFRTWLGLNLRVYSGRGD